MCNHYPSTPKTADLDFSRKQVTAMDGYEGNDRCFLKILLEDKYYWKEKLRIPPEFRRHLSEEAMGKFNLKGPGRKIWEVSLRRKGKEIYLQDGWKNFCEDNRLGNAEFLIFWYDGRKSFKVQIFGRNGFERMDNSPNTSVEAASASAPRSEIGNGLEQEKREERQMLKSIKEEETGNEPGPSVPLCARNRNLSSKKRKTIRL